MVFKVVSCICRSIGVSTFLMFTSEKSNTTETIAAFKGRLDHENSQVNNPRKEFWEVL